MLRKAMSAAIMIAGLAGGTAVADTLVIEKLRQGAAENVPARGQNKAEVNESFGSPTSRNEAVGEPPISSWEYTGYVVYFENDLVLHTVAKR